MSGRTRIDRCSRSRVPASACLLTTMLVAALMAPPIARATFHFAHIDEVLTSLGGDETSQFVEIVMDAGGQNLVSGSKLAAFDAAGVFQSVVLTVPSNVAGGSGRRWIMGTTQFENDSGLTADFIFSGGLPTGGGMICWGKPNNDTNPTSYVDCVAYGSYSGASNPLIGTATPLTADGHSLRRIGDTANNAADFECADPGDPQNNAFETVALDATTPCSSSCGDATGDDNVTASDALFALASAVGAQSCELCRCDADGSGVVTASDALRILAAAVGQNVTLDCQACS